MDKRIDNLLREWQRRNIQGFYCENRDKAVEKILEVIALSETIGLSGSRTLDQLGIVSRLEERGNKVFNPYKSGISREENLEMRRKGAQADYYLASPNAISETGELVFFSAYGNRIAGASYAKNTLVIAGVNKIRPDLHAAMKRAREYATPLNSKRLNWNSYCLKDGICRDDLCFYPGYKRMCCQVLIIEAEVTPERLKVILVGEDLGF